VATILSVVFLAALSANAESGRIDDNAIPAAAAPLELPAPAENVPVEVPVDAASLEPKPVEVTESAVPPAPGDVTAVVETGLGSFEIKLYGDKAPITVSNFVELVRRGYYNGLKIHRVIGNVLIQTGDPRGDGTGGPGYTFADEFHDSLKHDKPGIVSMANGGPNANGSQFFVSLLPQPSLDRRHSVFGEVVKGLDVVRALSNVPAIASKPRPDIFVQSIKIVGDFSPREFEKVAELSPEAVQALATPIVTKILEKVGEAQNLGTISKVEFRSVRSRGRSSQIEFSVDYAEEKGGLILVYGQFTGTRFDVLQFQFTRSLQATRALN
jgi:peptidyl-prolyl cis-trans isomerase A (cyclophilin A)